MGNAHSTCWRVAGPTPAGNGLGWVASGGKWRAVGVAGVNFVASWYVDCRIGLVVKNGDEIGGLGDVFGAIGCGAAGRRGYAAVGGGG